MQGKAWNEQQFILEWRLRKSLLLFQIPTNMEKSLMHAMLSQKLAKFFHLNHY